MYAREGLVSFLVSLAVGLDAAVDAGRGLAGMGAL